MSRIPVQLLGRRNRTASDTAERPTFGPRSTLGPAPTLPALLDEAFDLFKAHWMTFAWMVALVFLPTHALVTAGANFWLHPLYEKVNAQSIPDLWNTTLLVVCALLFGAPGYSVPGIIMLAALILASGPVMAYTSQLCLGAEPNVGLAFRNGCRRLAGLLSAAILAGLTFVGVALGVLILYFVVLVGVALAINATGAHLANELATVMALLMFALPALGGAAAIAQWFCFEGPLIVFENQSLFGLPVRNSQLAGRKRFLQRWSAMVFLPIVTWGLQFLFLLAVHTGVSVMHLSPTMEFLLDTLFGTVVALISQPFWMIFLTLWYYNYRIQNEGLDLFLLADVLPLNEVPLSQPVPAPMAPAPATPIFEPSSAPDAVPMRPIPVIPPLPTASLANQRGSLAHFDVAQENTTEGKQTRDNEEQTH